jgi:hypothetical protein
MSALIHNLIDFIKLSITTTHSEQLTCKNLFFHEARVALQRWFSKIWLHTSASRGSLSAGYACCYIPGRPTDQNKH